MGLVARSSAQTLTEVFTSRLPASRLLCQVKSANRRHSESRTLGCVPTCDRELVDTLDILKYANRANSIRNRITVNQDNWNHTSAAHRVEIQKLKLELMEYKQGKRMAKDGTEQVNDMFYETSLLQTGNYIRKRNEALGEMIEHLTAKFEQNLFFCEDESEKGTDADEDTADNIGNGSSAYEAEEMDEYVSTPKRSSVTALPSFGSIQRKKASRKAAKRLLNPTPSLESVWSQHNLPRGSQMLPLLLQTNSK
ncbi:hypothetical protein HPB50_010954 [Hyalomma asiaticum]|uniref:Uncharacterized protein n=1 Tax=Hyalomma asiaticum TaxID=266040 RepID=A0ACB7TMA4_HYAAI|nr:hypothetical protein HPB50_010954 [Hyalomma asiaticum]